MSKRIILAGVCALSLMAGAANAGVSGITIADASSGNYTLTSVTVTRGSAGTITYVPTQLTGIDLTDVGATGTPLAAQSGTGLPAAGARAALLEDNRLDSGVINPVSTAAAADFSFEVTFLHPVVNSTGDDILVFELGGNDTTRFWINNDRTQYHDIAPGNFSSDLLTGMPYSLYSYNNNGDVDINDLAELESSTGFSFNANSTSSVNAAGIDLSLFGIPLGGTLTSMRFQSVGTNRLDPVMIVGLPVVPEPATSTLALAGAAMLLCKRRAC